MNKPGDQHNREETERRREAALKKMLTTPHKPHKPLGKKPSGARASPASTKK